MKKQSPKAAIYEYTSVVGKALSSPSRLELLDLLCQSEKSVDDLASEAGLNVKITSAHLKVLKAARLVETRRSGRYIYYRAADTSVGAFWAKFRTLAEERFVEIQKIAEQFISDPSQMNSYDRKTLLKKAKDGDVVVIDVRPANEFAAGHIPHARSIPLSELKKHLATLNPSREVVAYCRGPYCVLSDEAVELLRKKGFRASRITDGVTDWAAAGLPIERTPEEASA